jgi:hypothetical protein
MSILCAFVYTLDAKDFCEESHCSRCLVGLSNLVMSYKCEVSELTLDDCMRFINNDLGALICGGLFETSRYWIRQQCMNRIEIPILARNLAVGICYNLCE